jgi:hypothetical protein
MLNLPTWIVEYATRRPTLSRPLTSGDYRRAEVSAMDRDGAAAAFSQRFGVLCRIVSIYPGSATGMA